MKINSLKLINWRSYESLELTFDPKINIITGKNGSGKSNLAEAIYYLSLTRSWRTQESKVLINSKSNQSYIKAEVQKGSTKKDIEIELKKGEKKVLINRKAIKGLTELSNYLNIIIFSPSDVPLFLESPSQRRNFLDISISKINPLYQEALINYNNLITQRNTLLKNEKIDFDLLSVLTQQLLSEGNKITLERYKYINQINEVLPNVMKELLNREVKAKLIYHPYIPVDEQMKENAISKYDSSQENDIRFQYTTVGPHKEDFDFLLDELDVASYGSQGQNRLSVLALKLSPYFLIEKEEEKPIVVLDDVTSELDKTNQNNLISFLSKLSQVFITATNLKVKDTCRITVSSNNASRRN